MNLTPTSTFPIVRNRRVNPCQYGSDRRGYWELIRDGMTVAEFASAFVAAYPSRSKPDAVRFLKVMVTVGWIEIRGYVHAPARRAPRVAAISSTALTTLATDLNGWTFGPEFELIMPRSEYGQPTPRQRVIEFAATRGVDIRQESRSRTIANARETDRSWWYATDDGSLYSFGNRGTEFKAPILKGQSGMDNLVAFCETMANHRWTDTNGRNVRVTAPHATGFHVHVGCKNEDANFFRNLLRLYGQNEDHINTVMPAHRRNSRWCGPVQWRAVRDDQTREQVIEAVAPQVYARSVSSPYKYRKVNLCRWWDIGTVEFRQAAGTFEADKAIYWVKFCLRLCNAAKSGRSGRVESFDALLTLIGATEDERAFWTRRRSQLARREGRPA